jgi:hypothetical protein
MTELDLTAALPQPGRDADLWFALVPGLDPRVHVPDLVTAAQYTVIACAGYALPPDPRRVRFTPGPEKLMARWQEWLTATHNDHDASLRRLALRTACTRSMAYHLPSGNILKEAVRFYRGSIHY